jgi:hypothetical protein
MWINTAWQHISPEVTVKGFKKCCVSNGMDGTDVDMLWNGSEQDGNVMNECEEDKGTDCEDGDRDTDW